MSEVSFRQVLGLALAGSIGTLCRWGASVGVARVVGTRFPWGTLAVNVLGCFCLAALMQLGFASEWIPRSWRMPIGVGFFGAFTTFSTFGFETMRYAQEGAWTLAGANVAANLVLCLGATWAGLSLGRWLT